MFGNQYLAAAILALSCLSKFHAFAHDNHSKAACLPPDQRLDCHPEPGDTQERCESRGCCWDRSKAAQPNVPACSYPAVYGGYRTVNTSSTQQGIVAFLERTFPSAFPDDVPLLRLDAEYLSDTILRVKISDAKNQRYEAFYPGINKPSSSATNPQYKLVLDENQTGFAVNREDGGSVFNALNVGALTFANQFLEISTLLDKSTKLFGIGEHRTNITIMPDWHRYTLFNIDYGPMEDNNLYGSHPFYMAVGEDGLFHGVFLHNSNAMDILTTPQPALTFRTIGGILDFYFFLGPTPADVVKQYTSLVGRSLMPPYWSLGFHLCRYGYGSSAYTREVWERNRALEIPFDAQWNDIDYMTGQNDFTVDPERYGDLAELIQDIHDAGMRWIPIIDPGISGSEKPGTYYPYDLAVEMDLLIKNKDGSILLGKVWNTVSTAWPDFFHPDIQTYWNRLVSDFYEEYPFDGIWIDMNEPAQGADGSLDGCEDDDLVNPPYSTGVTYDKLSSRTVCMNAKHANYSHYDVHNLFSIAEAEVTNKALRNIGKRPFVLSRSTFSGSGQFTGHWSGDNVASWYDLQKSVQELVNFNIFGVSLMGTDICGFRGNTNQALCNRWFQVGSFYTFCRNHNDLGLEEQDPAVYDNATIASIRKSLTTRYTLLPFLYTLFYESHGEGTTVARPLFFEFPNDPNAYEVETAFMWGSGLYIIPVVEDNAVTVEAYLPEGRWYDWYTGSERNSSGEYLLLDAPYDTIPLFLHGGSIIPTQAPALTTTQSRKNGITYIISPSTQGKAAGRLYWDDGEVIDPVENDVYGLVDLNYSAGRFTSIVKHWTTEDIPNIEALKVLGLGSNRVSSVTVNGLHHTQFSIDFYNVLHIIGFSIAASNNLVVEWR